MPVLSGRHDLPARARSAALDNLCKLAEALVAAVRAMKELSAAFTVQRGLHAHIKELISEAAAG